MGSSRFARRYYGNPLFSSGYVRCFSSPGSLRALLRRSSVSRWGCPIRTPQDHRLPAPPLRVSSRGHVLHRPLAPRHPPCALRRLCLPTSSVITVVRLRGARGDVCFAVSHARSAGRATSIVQGTATDSALVEPRGFEPRTSAVQRRRSPRLSYGPFCSPPDARPVAGVGAPGLEPGTSALSGPRSNHLSYAPMSGCPQASRLVS